MSRVGYPNPRSWVEARAGRPEPPGDTALVLMVPGADPVVRGLRQRHDPAAALGVGAHVTVLYPFVPLGGLDGGVEGAVGAVARRHAPFDLRFTEVRAWPGVVYLAVEPEAPVRALTADAAGRWPEHPPYGGVFDESVPHLTVGHGGADLLREARMEITPRLPLRVEATELTLIVLGRERWSARRSFPLGG